MKTVFLFPGQGAQSAGMGADLYQKYDVFANTFDECEKGAGLNLKAACFEGERQDEGEVVQPAIFTVSAALTALLKSEGIAAQALAGLSLGEYSALTAAGVFSPAQCAALVRKRGAIMDEAFANGQAGMLSVIGFTAEQVQEMIEGQTDVYIANHLSELQIVLAGYREALEALAGTFEAAGAKMVTQLAVRGPSHAPLLQNASEQFAKVLEDEPLGQMSGTVYSNALGEPYGADSDIKALLAAQMRQRVRWHEITEHMIEAGFERFIEVGPGNVLSKLVKRRVGRGGAETAAVGNVAAVEKLIAQNHK